jgi:Probable zinc-ribbon domain
MGGKRKAQLKTTSRAASLGKKTKTRVPDLICPCCGQSRNVSEKVAPLRIELLMRAQAANWLTVEVGWSVTAARHKWLTWACEACIKAGRALEAKPWVQAYGYNSPQFAYVDEVKTCSDCGNEFVFAATEQAFWYETLEFLIYSRPKQCVSCRHKRRVVKQASLEVAEVLGSFEGSIPELLQLADLYEKMGNLPKALEFLRRAKNKSRDEVEKQVLLERIAVFETQHLGVLTNT